MRGYNVYTGVTVPQSTYLVTPVVPELAGGAFYPGPPCPCNPLQIPIFSESRNYYVTMTKCAGYPATRTTTLTYTKDEKPGDLTEEEEADWDAAWPVITFVVKEELLSPYSKFETWNLNSPNQTRSESGVCEFVVVSEEWDPGELDANPGYATYTLDTEVEETEVEDTPAADLSAPFEGEFEGDLGTGYSTSMDDDGDESTGHKTQWRWVIDLSNWPASREWPDGLVIQGTVVWQTETTTVSSDEEVEPVKNTTLESEPFRIEKDDPIWRGDTRVSSPSGSPGRGKTRIQVNFLPPAFVHLLPFE
jgi:hypothetical protein